MAPKSWDTPSSLWMNGRLVSWDEAVVHVTSGYAQRGASVFEGLRVYKTAESGVYLALALAAHLQRLETTWSALSLPASFSSEAVPQALAELLRQRENGDYYCRVTRFLDLPSGEDRREADGLFVALYQVAPLVGKPVSCVTSPWRRNAVALPAQMKIGGHYFLLSWLRQQARRSGADEAILLNDKDLICEATGTAVFLFVNGELVTPPASDGALPSITARIVTRLAGELGIPASTRSIHRTEVFAADATFLAGSLDELRPVTAVDGVGLRNALDAKPVRELFEGFLAICRAERHHEWGEVIRPS
jgi:branched-chain amino acid aminotransferase